MPTIPALSNDAAPEASRPLLEAVEKKLGKVPNVLRTLAHSPAALQSYLSLSEAFAGGSFSGPEREVAALAIGQANSCDYCLAAHTAIGGMQGLSEDEILGARSASSKDDKQRTLAKLAQDIVISRGNPSESSLKEFLGAGWTQAHLVELIGLVTLNTLTNYTNHIAGTEIDFPAAPELQSA